MLVEGLVRPRELQRLARIVHRIKGQWCAENRSGYLQQGLVNMHSLTHPRYFENHAHERLDLFRAMTPPRLVALLDRLFGDGVYFHNSQLFFNPHDVSRPACWHRDLQYSAVDPAAQQAELLNLLALHVRIPLVPETGIELIPGTHGRWDTPLERDVRMQQNGRSGSEDLPGALQVSLEAGDVLIFSAQMIHRGNYRLNPCRLALDLCVGKQHPFTAAWLDADNLPTEQELERIDNRHWYEAAWSVIKWVRGGPSGDGSQKSGADQPGQTRVTEKLR